MRDTAVTTGSFDGFHIGHKAVADFLKSEALKRDLCPVALTFDRHPLETIAPARAPKIILDPELRNRYIEQEGLELKIIPFNEQTRRLTAEKWIEQLAGTFGTRLIVMGYDNTLGCDGLELTTEQYREAAARHGVEILRAPVIDGVSSSAIRKAVDAGNLKEAERMLGRPFSIYGDVEHGKALGRQLGFPTANIAIPSNRLLPPTGVYAAKAHLGDGPAFPAALNIGYRPSVDTDGKISAEAHLIGFSGDIYGQKIEVTPVEKIRDEMHFPDIDRLKKALADDVAATAGIIGNQNL